MQPKATTPAVQEVAPAVTLQMRVGDKLVPIEAEIGRTLLDAAHANAVNVDGTCDGDLACSTCHCIVGDPAEARVAEKSALEDDLLSSAFDVKPNSRLACQVTPR
jgi:2Fe-2S ferredoxin